MLEKGVYYFWIARTYPWGDIGRSITQWVYVGLGGKICPSGNKAFVARCTRFQKKPWGYTCSSSRDFEMIKNKDFSIDDQLSTIKNDVKNQVQLHEIAMHLRPLELMNYWSEELHSLLEEYLEIEVLVYQEGLKRKCEWLINFIDEQKIDFTQEQIKYRVDNYARETDVRVNVVLPKKYKHPAAEWVLRRVSVKPKSKGTGDRIQKPDVILYYPVFRKIIPNIDHLVDSLGIKDEILERWGYL